MECKSIDHRKVNTTMSMKSEDMGDVAFSDLGYTI